MVSVGDVMSREVLTIATGSLNYFSMAIAFARSFKFWNSGNGIGFRLVTDTKYPLPADLHDIDIARYKSGEIGRGFGAKLLLDRFAIADRTLFIDADCLCFGDIAPIFERFSGRSVAVVGGEISSGEWFGNVGDLCKKFSVRSIPKFNGGLYYIERGEQSERVYALARKMTDRYDSLGLVRLRGFPNDELLIALAMAVEGCDALADDGTIFGDLYAYPVVRKLDVARGVACLSNPPASNERHQPGYRVGEVNPRIVHFLGGTTMHWRYRGEVAALRASARSGLSLKLVAPPVRAVYSVSGRLRQTLKDVLRPVYRRTFGVRRIKSDRLSA